MRPLNRPMFRYGGPIKEGIMDGIREPKKNGGAMGINKPKRGLVDEPGSYAGFLALPYIGAGLTALRVGAQRAIPTIANLFRTQTGTKTVARPGPIFQGKGTFVGDKGVRIPSSGSYSGVKYVPGRTIGTGTMEVPVYSPNFLGRDPTVRLIGGAYKAITNPAVTGIAGKTARFVFSPTGLVAGAIYAGGKFFDSDGNEIENPEQKGLVPGDRIGTSGAPGGGDPGMYLTPKAKGDEGVTLSDEELRKQRVNRYRDIMDIKGMNKKAAYNSLIEASRLINESGDFKGDLKSGKLINQIVQAASKQFDKPAQTKDAIDTLILKGEIEKDIKASDPQAQKKAQLLDKQIKIADKTLAGDTFTDIITERYSKGKVPRGNELAGILRATEGVDVTVIDSTKIPQGVDAQTFFESQVNEAKTKGTPVVPGYYVISDRVLIVDAQGNVTPFL